MRNPDIPKLLRAIQSTVTLELYPIFEQAAVELEKLEKIYKLIDDDTLMIHKYSIVEILNEAP